MELLGHLAPGDPLAAAACPVLYCYKVYLRQIGMVRSKFDGTAASTQLVCLVGFGPRVDVTAGSWPSLTAAQAR